MRHFLEKLEDRTLLNGGYSVSIGDGFAKSVGFTDADGTAAVISVKGGWAEFLFAGDNVGYVAGAKSVTGESLALAQILLSGTTAKSAITITASGGDVPGITVELIEGDNHSLGALTAATTNLVGKGLFITGGIIGKLTLGSVSNTDILMSSPVAPKGISISVIGEISDCVISTNTTVSGLTCGSLDHAGLSAPSIGKVVVNGVANESNLGEEFHTDDIGSLQAVAWNGGQIYAKTLGTLKITGQKAVRGGQAIPGDFTGGMTLDGPGMGPAVPRLKAVVKPTLNTATVAGTWATDGSITGLVNSLTVGHLGATLYVGGSVKSFKTSDPMALTAPRGGSIGGLSVAGSASVTAGKQKLNLSHGQLFTSTNEMYRLADLWQLEGGYDQSFSGKTKGPGGAGLISLNLTTDGAGGLSMQDVDYNEMFGMDWAIGDGQLSMGYLNEAAALGDYSLTFTDPPTLPEYLEMGRIYTAASALHGNVNADLYGLSVDLILDGTVNMSVQLVDHEIVMVNGESVLAAKIQFGLSMSGPFTATVEGQDFAGRWSIKQQMQLYSTPNGGLVRVAMQLTAGASLLGHSGSANASIDVIVDSLLA